jgi:4-hydroxybenzoate polyprenyltransferase
MRRTHPGATTIPARSAARSLSLGSALAAVAALLRAPEWAKNLFALAPILFSGRLLDLRDARAVAFVFAALCCASSSVYILNDLMDIERDRAHPVKRRRPLPSGQITPRAAGVIGLGLIAAGYGALSAARVSPAAWGLIGGYLALHILYSCYFKQKVILDVLVIAVGFVLRVLAGGAAIGVAVTHWLVLCTFLLATFLGFSKRRHEISLLGRDGARHRPVLALYTEEFLDRMSMLTLAMALTCYILYTIAPETVARFGTNALVYSALIVMFALFRYLFLIHVKRLGSPTDILYRDRQLVLAILFWVLYVIGIVYTWPTIAPAFRGSA